MPSLPGSIWWAFGVCLDLIGGEALASNQSLYLSSKTPEAAPKCISGSTSYLQVWLAFHPYPQVIQRLFNVNWFGPPLPVTATSTCSRVDHLVSRLLPPTIRPVKTRLPFDCVPKTLNLAGDSHSSVPYAKGTPSHLKKMLRPLVSKRFQVLFHSSVRGSFHLSLTVLVHYRSLGSI